MALGMAEETALLRHVLFALFFREESAFDSCFRFLVGRLPRLLGLSILGVVALLRIILALATYRSGRMSRCFLGFAAFELLFLVLSES